ncbi:MAG: hypothetical protein OXG97_04215 [Candidatus Poribacteria bacterium]|nr:hypothetical protein [Candidatus Poribacteria bacterium]
MYRVNGILILAVFIVLFTGCDYLDGYKEENMPITIAGLVSISDDRPAEVVIGAFGSHRNTCVKLEGKVYANRDGNKIYLTGEMEIPLGPGACGQAITDVYGEVAVKNLEVGEYIIEGDSINTEIGRFRIESDAAYMEIEPAKMYSKKYSKSPSELDVIFSPTVPDDGEFKDTSYHVKIVVDIVKFYIDNADLLDEYKDPCYEPIYKTDIDRTGDVINLNIWRLVPTIDSGCTLKMSLGADASAPWYGSMKAEIDIGMFSPGLYTVFIKGEEFYFNVT